MLGSFDHGSKGEGREAGLQHCLNSTCAIGLRPLQYLCDY